MKKTQKPSVAIVGAGIAGCFLAILFAKREFRIDIYERATAKQIQANATRRSFNLTFYKYAVNILKEINLWNAIKSIVVNLRGVAYQTMYSKKMRFMPFSKNSQNFTLSRADILRLFIKKAQSYSSISFHFNTAFIGADMQKKTIHVQDLISKKNRTVNHSVVFGADGVNSIVRQMIPQTKAKVQEFSDWSYKQIRFTKEDVKKLKFRTNTFYLLAKKNIIFLIFPHNDGGYNALFVLPKTQKYGFTSLTTPMRVKACIVNNFPVFAPMLDTITNSLLHNPEGNFTTIYADKWYSGDFLALVGDSAHGMFPFYGQGTSAAFADAEKLASLTDIYGNNWKKIFPLYQAARKPHTDVLAALSIENFERYQNSRLIIKNKIESILHDLFPKIFLPLLFSSVTSDPTHAADHLMRYEKQQKILNFFGFSIFVRCVAYVIDIYGRVLIFTKIYSM